MDIEYCILNIKKPPNKFDGFFMILYKFYYPSFPRTPSL